MCACAFACVRVRVRAQVYMHGCYSAMQLPFRVFVPVYVHVCMYVCTCACVHVRARVRVCVHAPVRSVKLVDAHLCVLHIVGPASTFVYSCERLFV